MSKRTVFTTITALPPGVTRQTVLDFLHDHGEMIDLNPLVRERHPIPTPPHAPADEQHCQWYSLTDKISYLPGVAGDVTYTCAFNDLPTGLQTHCYAPAGLTIRDKWTVGGSDPGEPPQPIELGIKAPPTGLYLREDVDMRCNVIMTSFVKKTLKKSHAALVDRLKIKAEIASINSKNKSNRNSDSSVTSVEQDKSLASVNDAPTNINGHQYHNLPTSAPPSRRSSATSSVGSGVSSLSSYNGQAHSMWSPPPTSSLGTSPALSATSPPPTHGGKYPSQPQSRPGDYLAQPQLPEFIPEPLSITLPVPESEPETPFLRQLQPDWPLRTAAPAPLQQQQSDWPLKAQRAPRAPRPQTQLFIQAYRPPPSHPAPATTPAPNSMPNTGNGAGAGALSDDALWLALGGGKFVARNVAGYSANNNRKSMHTRAQSYGGDSHPDYPQMSPYDDDFNHDHDVNGGGKNEAGFVGLGVAGAMRPVSMPPPLKPRVASGATLKGPFVARLN